MNFRQLESLVWVAKLQSFAAAAEKLHATQPTISIRIQELEKELGVALFERSQRGVRLSPRGRECLVFAEQILAWAGELRIAADDKTHLKGRVSLGVSEIIAHTWLPDLLTSLNETYPDLAIDTEIDLTPKLIDGLQSGNYDVVLVGTRHLLTTFQTIFLGMMPFVWVARPGCWTGPAPLTPATIQSRRIIVYAKGSMIHDMISEWFVANQAFPTNKITCNTATTMISLAESGLGLTLVPRALVERDIAEGRLEVVPTSPAFAPLRYYALSATGPRNEVGEIISKVAATVSSFDK